MPPETGCLWCGDPKATHVGKTSFRLESQQPGFASVHWTTTACSRPGCMCRRYESRPRGRQRPR